MTRFTRAKGSKASNERQFEEPTPWHVMKQDIENAVASKKNDQEHKPKSAKELLKEKDDPYYSTTSGNVNTDWAEFKTPNENNSKKEKIQNSKDTLEKRESKKRKSNMSLVEEKENDCSDAPEKHEDIQQVPAKKSNVSISVEKCVDSKSNTTADVVEPNLSVKKKKKKDKKSKIVTPSETSETICSDNQHINSEKSDITNDTTKKVEEPSMKLSKRQKRNRKNKIKTANNNEINKDNARNQNTSTGTFNTDGNEWNNDVKFGNSKLMNEQSETLNSNPSENENKFEDKNHLNNPRENGFKKFDSKFKNQVNAKKRKPPKVRDDKEHKRRKPNPGSTKVIINGMEVEIVMYDGFPIKKEDAERLKDMRQQMVMKGIQKSEIDMAMKLERRKAEKALTRIKKHVCFHCRKAGHNLSDCPELSKEESATGICFKCGSTEHTHFECKVNKKEEFRFATCFICREQGHIAKQCPDNPKGLYPDGGSCKICGDVTHLKKDCPEFTTKKEEDTMTLSTIGDNALESLDDDNVKKSEDCKKPTNKIVKF